MTERNTSLPKYRIYCPKDGWQIAVNPHAYNRPLSRGMREMGYRLIGGRYRQGDCPKCGTTLAIKEKTK